MTHLRLLGLACVCVAALAGCAGSAAQATTASSVAEPAVVAANDDGASAPVEAPAVASADPPPSEPLRAAARLPDSAHRLDEHRGLGDALHVGVLTVWPVLSDADDAPDAFAALPQAQAARKADVFERGADATKMSLAQRFRTRLALHRAPDGQASAAGGSRVRSVLIDNGGAVPLLVSAGTLIRGGSQDRVIAEDLVVPPDTAVDATVFCVEAGRWSAERGGVATGERFDALDLVAIAPVRAAAQHERSQGAVWENVGSANEATIVVGGTAVEFARSRSGSFLQNVENAPDEVRAARRKTAEAIRAHLRPASPDDVATVGFAYAIKGRVVSVRAFATGRLFEARMEGFVQAMVLEAESAPRHGANAPPAARPDDVVALVRAIEAAPPKVVDRATHVLRTRSCESGWSSACLVRAGGREIALSEDWQAR